MTYSIYCDGAATMKKVNGEYVRECGGWAYVFIDENNNCIRSCYGGKNLTTNNEMELTAIQYALEKAFENFAGTDIIIYTDSAYCIGIFTDWINNWKKNGWTRTAKHLPIENVEIIKAIDKLISLHRLKFNSVSFVKVHGHSGDQWNEYVDKLAVRGKTEDACHGIRIEF